MIFPETYFLISVFTGFSIWLMISEAQDIYAAVVKKGIAMMFAFIPMMIISTMAINYVVYQDRSVSVSDVLYQGATNKIDNITNSYLPSNIQRLTLSYATQVFDILRTFFVMFFFVSVGLFIYSIGRQFLGTKPV